MDSLQLISLCTNLFYVFAGVAAASFLLSVFLFFKFDIPYTYSMLTGKAKKRTIEQMEKQKFQTGKLRMNYPTGNTGPRTKKQGKTGAMTGHTAPPPPAAPSYAPAPVTYAPPPAPPAVEYTPETQVLGMDTPETQILAGDTPQIQTLHEEDEATMVLRDTLEGPCTEDLNKTTILRPEPEMNFLFQITEETISINTNELI